MNNQIPFFQFRPVAVRLYEFQSMGREESTRFMDITYDADCDVITFESLQLHCHGIMIDYCRVIIYTVEIYL